MSESWNAYADGWDSNTSVIAYSEQAFQALLSVVEARDLGNARALDFGCGTGLLTEKLSQKVSSVVALDPADKMIAVLDSKQIGNVDTIATELSQQLISESESLRPKFDLVVASSALAFVPDYIGTLRLIRQLLKAGGVIVQWDWLKADGEAGSGFSPEEIQSALTGAGFSGVNTSIPFSLASEAGAMPVLMGTAYNP